MIQTPAGRMTRLASYADVDFAFRSKHFAQASHREGERRSAPLYMNNLLTLSGEAHYERRRLESALFRRSTLLHLERDLLEPALRSALAARRSRAAGEPARADLMELIRNVLLNVTATVVGLDGMDAPGAIERLGACADRLTDGANVLWTTRPADAVMEDAMAARERFVAEFYEPARERRRGLVEAARGGRLGAAEPLPDDLITLMLTHADVFSHWDQGVFVREATLYVVASASTTTNLVPHVIADVEAWVRAHPEDASGPMEGAFLNRSIHEALRAHLSVPMLFRRATVDLAVPSGLRVAAGEQVALDLVAASHDPAVFAPNPDVFDPHREVPAGVRPYAFAFGGGPHTCIGKALVLGAAEAAATDQVGTARRILSRLYAGGVRTDPDRPPRPNTDNVRGEYRTFPVLFDRLG